MSHVIDINCDMGEGMGNESSIFPCISSANIACGWHAGSEDTIRETMQLAKQFNVAVGAHPSFADREHFGRKEQRLSPSEIYALVTAQLLLMQRIAAEEGVLLCHVKPHGALYNMSAKDMTIATAIARAVKDFSSHLLLYGLSGSCSIQSAQAVGITAVPEVFADRRYQPDGSLVPRSEAGAVISDVAVIVEQALLLVKAQNVLCANNTYIHINAGTICLHGDTEGAENIAREIYAAFREHLITVRPYERK